MNRFPLEIVHRILEYDGKIKYRNGEYINQISPDDDRYKMLQTIPQIQPHKHSFWIMMSVSCKTNKIYCIKHIASSLELNSDKGPILLETYRNKMEVRYSYYNQGFHYKFIIYKTSQPTFIEFLLKNIITFIDDINTFVHLIM